MRFELLGFAEQNEPGVRRSAAQKTKHPLGYFVFKLAEEALADVSSSPPR